MCSQKDLTPRGWIRCPARSLTIPMLSGEDYFRSFLISYFGFMLRFVAFISKLWISMLWSISVSLHRWEFRLCWVYIKTCCFDFEIVNFNVALSWSTSVSLHLWGFRLLDVTSPVQTKPVSMSFPLRFSKFF